MQNTDDIKKLLAKASSYIKTNRKNNHNIFEILKIEDKEVSTHSVLIYYLLTLDETYLYLFIKHVLEITNVSELDPVSVKREYIDKNVRIDFLVSIRDIPYAIEMKIWSKERDNQLLDYYNVVSKLGGSEVYFLTPNASESKTYDKAKPISFEKHIKNWLNAILTHHKENEKKDNQNLVFIIKQYIDTIDNLTLEHKGEREKMNFFTSYNDLRAVDTLVDAKNSFLSQLKAILFDYLAQIKLPRVNLESSKQSEKSLSFMVLLASDNKENLNIKANQNLWFHIEIERRLYCGFTIQDEGNNKIDTEEIISVLKKGNIENTDTPGWLTWKYLESDKEKIDFYNLELLFKQLVISGQLVNNDDPLLINDHLSLNQKVLNTIEQQIKDFYNKVLLALKL